MALTSVSPISPYVLGGTFTSKGITIKIAELLPKVHDNPVLEFPVPLLAHLLEQNVWGHREGPTKVAIAPHSVIATRQPADHWKRILEADLSYPILVYFNDKGYLNVIDGMHRLSKAVREQQERIMMKIVDKSQMT